MAGTLLNLLRSTLFKWEVPNAAPSWVTWSIGSPFGKIFRRLLWLFSTCDFCQAEYGSQKKIRVLLLPREVAGLKASRIGELAAVVGQDDREQFAERLQAESLLQPVEDVDDRLRGVGVPDEGEHQAAGVEVEGEKHLSPACPLDGVHLDQRKVLVRGHERLVVPEPASLEAAAVHLVHRPLRPMRTQLRRDRQVDAPKALESPALMYV